MDCTGGGPIFELNKKGMAMMSIVHLAVQATPCEAE